MYQVSRWGLDAGPHSGPLRGHFIPRDEARVIGNIRFLQRVFLENKSVSFDTHRSRPGASIG
jgi:hypothetical protein